MAGGSKHTVLRDATRRPSRQPCNTEAMVTCHHAATVRVNLGGRQAQTVGSYQPNACAPSRKIPMLKP